MNTTTAMAGAAGGEHTRGRANRQMLFVRVMERIHRYFVKLVWDPHGVDDCQQQTLLRIEKALREGRYDAERSFNRFMWTIAHRVYVDYCRAKTKAPAPLPEGLPRAGPSEATRVEERLDAEAILARMRQDLSPEAFEVFVLRYDQGHTVSKIGVILDRDRKTVRKRLDEAVRLVVRLQKPTP